MLQKLIYRPILILIRDKLSAFFQQKIDALYYEPLLRMCPCSERFRPLFQHIRTCLEAVCCVDLVPYPLPAVVWSARLIRPTNEKPNKNRATKSCQDIFATSHHRHILTKSTPVVSFRVQNHQQRICLVRIIIQIYA